MCGSILAYNGEVFGGLEVAPGQNDGHVLLNMLCEGRLVRIWIVCVSRSTGVYVDTDNVYAAY